MEICEQRAVAARAPPEKIKERRIVGLLSSGRHAPGRAAAFVEAQDSLRGFIEMDVAKILCRFRPARRPAFARDQPALVRSIPGFDADLDRQKPGEGK
jgi:hypothetical protein